MAAFQINNPPLYYFDESRGIGTNVLVKYGSNLYQILDNGVGASGPLPGGTFQFFIHKSADNGATWTEITPVSPVQLACGGINSNQFQNIVIVSNIVYVMTNPGGDTSKFCWSRFDLNTEAWLSDGSTLSASGNLPQQAVYRASDTSIVVAQHSNNDSFLYFSVYAIGSNTWTVQNQLATGTVDRFSPYAICADSANRVHVICAQTDIGLTVNWFHITLKTDNTNTNPDSLLAGAHVDPVNGKAGRIDVSSLVSYLDVGTATQMLGFLLIERSASTTTATTTLTLWTAAEGVTPVWTTVTVPTAEASDVRLANTSTSATAGPIPGLLALQLSASTRLYVIWTASGSQIATPGQTWNNYMRWLTTTDSGVTFSAITTDYQSLATELVPGPVYPIISAQTGDAFTIGIFFPVIDEAIFGSINTKYSSLGLWFDSFSGGGSPIAISCNNPPGGTVGKPYSHTITAAGGTVPYSFAITGGALPTGLSIAAATGIISGTPTVAGLFTFAVTVSDSAPIAPDTATIACSITIGLLPLETVSGGGTSTKCRTVQCHPKLQTACMGWGPLSITKDRTGTYAVYQDSRGSLQTWRINPDGDVMGQLSSGIARAENAPAMANNPGGLKVSYGQLDRSGSLVMFPDWDTGNRALREAIMAALLPRKDEVL